MSKSSLKSYISILGYKFIDESDDMLIYNGKYKEMLDMYSFDDNGAMNSAGVVIDVSYSSEFIKYLKERYLYVGTSDGMVMYITLDKNNVIGYKMAYDNGELIYLVVYVDASLDVTMKSTMDIMKRKLKANVDMMK